jgi:predicted nucleotide-binding protein (sugar kinase/HSP70/actin superfamily)
VNVIAGGSGDRAFFGDTCERYTSRAASLACRIPNLPAEYLERCEALFSPGGGSGLRIGVPRASSLLGALPFWATFFKELGHRPVLSGPSSPETLALGLDHLSVGMCLPMKLVTGHVHALLARGVDLVFVPAVTVLPGDDPARSYSCPYTMAEPFLVGAPEKSRILSPVVTFESEQAFAAGFDPYREVLGVSTGDVCEAFRAARFAQRELDELFRERVRQLLASGAPRHVFAVLARPYVTLDAYANLALFERLRRLGVLGIPLDMLPLPSDEEGPPELPWRFPADSHRAAAALAALDGVHPALVSCFGCGPDGFAVPRIEETLGRTPHVMLELDEHRGEAGLVTRIEAFLDQLDGAPRRNEKGTEVPRRAAAFIPEAPSVVRIPYFADHAYAFSGLFRLKGHDARVLPLPGPQIRALGESVSLGKECHAYSMIAGDLVNLWRERAGEAVFYFPGTSIPCLLHEYGRSMERLLSRLAAGGIRVSSPNAAELFAAFGIDAIERLYLGLLAIELLAKAVCQVRPYELAAGTTDAVHRRNLERIETAIAEGDVLSALDESLHALAAIPMEERRSRPIVGLAGDIYTRVNPAGNNDIVRWLEERGLEVWPSPFQIDLIDFDISRRVHRSLASHDLSGLLVHGPVALRRELQAWRTRRVVGSQLAHRDEPGYLELKKLAAPYMPNEAHELLYLNVAKIVDFAQGGVDGIVNAVCFGCMVGNASAAIIERIRRDYDGLPIITAVYSGAEDPSRRMVLEAFVGQVKAHNRRMAAPGAA